MTTITREMSIGDIRSLPAPCCERLLQVYGLQRLMLGTAIGSRGALTSP